MSTVDALKTLIHQHFGIDPNALDAGAPLSSYSIDSLTLAELAFAIEEAFGVTVPDTTMHSVQTLAQLAAAIDRLRVPQRA